MDQLLQGSSSQLAKQASKQASTQAWTSHCKNSSSQPARLKPRKQAQQASEPASKRSKRANKQANNHAISMDRHELSAAAAIIRRLTPVFGLMDLRREVGSEVHYPTKRVMAPSRDRQEQYRTRQETDPAAVHGVMAMYGEVTQVEGCRFFVIIKGPATWNQLSVSIRHAMLPLSVQSFNIFSKH